MDLNLINIISLAYLGDAVYELYIREKLVLLGINKVNELQKKATYYVSAKGQNVILDQLISLNILTDLELDVVKRGRNYKRNSHPKNTDVITYKRSSGFEALIGYLYLSDKERLREILDFIEVK